MSDVFVFRYIGAYKDGEKTKGVVVAEDKKTAISRLESRGIYTTKIYKVPRKLLEILPIDNKQLSLVFDGLGKMIQAGIDYESALDLLMREQFNPKLAFILHQVKENIRKGFPLHKAFETTGAFSKDTIKMIEVGIEGGHLPEVLENLSSFYENKSQISKSIKNASYYPVGIIVGIFFIVIFGIPRIIDPLIQVYSRFPNIEFPVYSKITISALQFLAKNSPFILAGLIAFSFFVYKAYKTKPSFKERLDHLILRLPVFGAFVKKMALYRFLVSLTILFKSGIPLVEAFKMITESMTNEVIRKEFEKTREELKKGVSLEKAIKPNRFITSMVKTLIAIGVTSGKLDIQLETLTKYEKESLDAYVKFIRNSVTPIFIAIAGFIVAAIVISVYAPMLGMIDIIKQGIRQ